MVEQPARRNEAEYELEIRTVNDTTATVYFVSAPLGRLYAAQEVRLSLLDLADIVDGNPALKQGARLAYSYRELDDILRSIAAERKKRKTEKKD